MEKKEIEKPVCVSIFKSEDNTTSRSRVTEKWIELINILEKNKEVTAER